MVKKYIIKFDFDFFKRFIYMINPFYLFDKIKIKILNLYIKKLYIILN
jgi:hypothetical protein